MWTVFKKELREGWLFLLVNILFVAGTPALGRLFLPRFWDADVNVIFYSIMFGVFIPLYLVILAAGLVQDENTPLVRGLPVKPWKVAGGKLLFLGFNLVLLQGLCIGLWIWDKHWPAEESLTRLLGLSGVLVCMIVLFLAAFVFATFMPRKSYAVFSAWGGCLLVYGTISYCIVHYGPAVIMDYAVLLGTLVLPILLLFAGCFVLYHDLIRQSRRRWIRAAIMVLLLPSIAGIWWLQTPVWLKRTLVAHGEIIPVADDLFITTDYRRAARAAKGVYLFDANSGILKECPFLGTNEEISGTDPSRGVVYIAESVKRDGKEFRNYTSLDPRTGKTEKLGLFPEGLIHFRGEIAYWNRWGREEVGKNQSGFKHLGVGTEYVFTRPHETYPAWGPEGVLYQADESDHPVWMFVDYASATPREAFRGLFHRWSWGDREGFFLMEGVRDHSGPIPHDRDCFHWFISTGELRRLGPGKPIAFRNGQVILLRGHQDGPKTLVLYREGREVSTLPTDLINGYPITHPGREWSAMEDKGPLYFFGWKDDKRKSCVVRTLTIEGETMRWTSDQPLSNRSRAMLIQGSRELLLFDWTRSIWSQEIGSYCVYRLDPATGKKKKLV